jgi:hypothetical protein
MAHSRTVFSIQMELHHVWFFSFLILKQKRHLLNSHVLRVDCRNLLNYNRLGDDIIPVQTTKGHPDSHFKGKEAACQGKKDNLSKKITIYCDTAMQETQSIVS